MTVTEQAKQLEISDKCGFRKSFAKTELFCTNHSLNKIRRLTLRRVNGIISTADIFSKQLILSNEMI